MKKIKCILLCSFTLLLTGCVKFNANMDIKKDKSMDFSIIYALDSSMLGDQKLLEDKDKKELETKGFIVTEYVKNNMKGFMISRNIGNIDFVSSATDTKFSLSKILTDSSENNYIFKVKKGLLKNTYFAKFEFDASDSNFSDEASNSFSGSDVDSNLSLDMDFSGMLSNMDLSFNVTLPYSAKSNNASTTNMENKNLSWNLSFNQAEAIEFEFELYNMTTIYIGLGVVIFLIIVAIVTIVNKNKKNKSAIISPQENINSQPMQSQFIMSNQNQISQQSPQSNISRNTPTTPPNTSNQSPNIQNPMNNQQAEQNNPWDNGPL